MKKQAVIQSGGKQYLVADGASVRVDKLSVPEGKKVIFDEVLLTNTDKTFQLGYPLVKGAKVEGTVTKQGRYKKIYGVKMKPKKRYKKRFGHKQAFTEVEITKITTK